jgi:hypothetical protein
VKKLKRMPANALLVGFVGCALLLVASTSGYLAHAAEPATAETSSTTEKTGLESDQQATTNDPDTSSWEKQWSQSARASVDQAAAEVGFKVFSLGDVFCGYPLTEVRVLDGSVFLFYRYDPTSKEAEAAGYEGFLIREFSTSDDSGLIGSLQSEYPVVTSLSRDSSSYDVRRGAGENRFLILSERQGTMVFIGMFVQPDPALLADAAAALKEVSR